VRRGGGRVVGRGVVHGHGVVRRVGQGHGEVEAGGAGVTLSRGHVADGDRKSVVEGEDGAQGRTGGDGRVGGVGQVHGERLVGLIGVVVVDRHGDGGRGVYRSEGGGCAGRRVVGRLGGRAVIGGVVHGHRLGGRVGQGHGEVEAGGAGVTLSLGHVAD